MFDPELNFMLAITSLLLCKESFRCSPILACALFGYKYFTDGFLIFICKTI